MADEGYFDALRRVNEVLDKLKVCSGELHDIERIMADAKDDGLSEERSGLLSTVRGMLSAVDTGLKRVPENQEESSRSKRMRCGRPASSGICTHTCRHHPVIVNPGLWSKLTDDLVGLVFARLPIPRIIGLRRISEAWAAMSNSASFKGAFAEANPRLFGLLGWDGDLEKFRTRIPDVTSKEWYGIKLDFPKGNGYMDSWYACDGGLVCFVPGWKDDEGFYCAFVFNPLTNAWKELPGILFRLRDPVLVQLVADELCYRVVLVYSEKLTSQDAQTFGAFVYDSRAGSWSEMSSGLVYGNGNTLGDSNDPLLFDCATRRLINLDSCGALQDLTALRYSILKDRLFVLHVLIEPDSLGHATEKFVISEFAWESSTSDLRKLNDYEVPLRRSDFGSYVARHDVEIFTSTGFILCTWGNLSENGSVRQHIRVYDISAGQWRDLTPLIGDRGIIRNEKLEDLFMCELRWDANPRAIAQM